MSNIKKLKSAVVDVQGLTTQEFEEKLNDAIKNYSEDWMNATLERFYEDKLQFEMSFDELEEWFKDMSDVRCVECLDGYIVDKMDDECYKYYDKHREDYDIQDMVIDYIENHRDEWVTSLQEGFVDNIAMYCMETDFYLPVYLEGEKSEQGEDFNLLYSVGNHIYTTCGDGSDDMVSDWVANHSSMIREKFSEFEG